MSNPTTMCEAFQQTAAVNPDAVALRSLGGAVSITWREYAARVATIASGLARLGVQRGDTVAIMLTNRPEFHLVDTAVIHLGATPFSIYNTNAPETIAYLFENAGNKIVVCEEQFVEKLQQAHDLGSKVEHLVCVDNDVPGTISLADVEAAPLDGFDFEASWRAVQPDDLLTIVYTSGTTGMPKGVELTHAGLLWDLEACDAAEFAGRPGDRVLSYLPDAHLANRVVGQYTQIMRGTQITTVATPREVLAGLVETRPQVFLGVPQTWYKIKTGLESALAAEPDETKRNAATWAFDVARRKLRAEQDGAEVSAELGAEYAEAERIVLAPLREKIGLDQVWLPVSGAAPLSPEAHEFMMALGVRVREAWGMTESSAGATASPIDDIRIGTVGKTLPGVELQVADDGELLLRGPLVMRAYRKEAEKTADAVDADGWLHTGDIGTVDADGYVRIVDRKKDLIINSSGKNMSPANIENTILDACSLVGVAVAIADQRPYVSTLLILDPEAVEAFAKRHGITDTSPAKLAEHPLVVADVQEGIDVANAKLSRVEHVRTFTILPEYWLPGSDVLTPTMKVRRKPVGEIYAEQIDAMYAR